MKSIPCMVLLNTKDMVQRSTLNPFVKMDLVYCIEKHLLKIFAETVLALANYSVSMQFSKKTVVIRKNERRKKYGYQNNYC